MASSSVYSVVHRIQLFNVKIFFAARGGTHSKIISLNNSVVEAVLSSDQPSPTMSGGHPLQRNAM